MLKWPNDVMLGGRKLAGILLERSADRVAVGFGVNLASAPDLDDRVAASLGGEMGPRAFAPLLAASFARRLTLWRSHDGRELANAWQRRAHPVGTALKVHLSREELVAGCFDGLEDDGAMRLRVSDGSIQLVRAGDVALD
jgi:BirA family biotin operon repressor/biotin-[acetyl-CoA-carboxylase] ligase